MRETTKYLREEVCIIVVSGSGGPYWAYLSLLGAGPRWASLSDVVGYAEDLVLAVEVGNLVAELFNRALHAGVCGVPALDFGMEGLDGVL